MGKDANDYPDFRMSYNRSDLEFLIESIKEFISSGYINNFYKTNSTLALKVIAKLEKEAEILSKVEGASNLNNVRDYWVFTDFSKYVHFEYEEIIVLRFYLSTLHLEHTHEQKRRVKMLSDLDEYIGQHRAWLDFRKITKDVD